jgi:hypothetical protein
MLLVLADHPHDTAAMDDLALVTNLLDRRTYLHEQLLARNSHQLATSG